MNRRQFLDAIAVSGVALLAHKETHAGVLAAGKDVYLRCLGDPRLKRFLDGRTGNGTVGLAPKIEPPFTGTKWHVWSGGGILLECSAAGGAGPRWLDGRTGDRSIGLAPSNRQPFIGTRWRVVPLDASNPNIVGLQCMARGANGAFWLDGRTQDGSVGLAPTTDPPFTGTRWEAHYYPVQIDPGTNLVPADD